MDYDSFDGMHILITGGNSGIGKGIASACKALGANIIILGRNKQTLRQTQQEIGQCHIICANVADSTEIKQVSQEISSQYGRLNCIVHAAGITIKTKIHQMEEEDWKTVLETNLTSCYLLAKYFYPLLKNTAEASNTAGKFIAFGSAGSSLGIPESGAYCASKGGLIQLVKVLAIEWAAAHIQVNAIIPGYIHTPLSASVLKYHDTYKKVTSRIPLGTIGNVEDIAHAVTFLCSQKSNYITGTEIRVDGGLLSTAYL